MPLAQAAPRIGCERSPSLARPGQRPTRFGPRIRTRGPASIDDRDGSFRAQAKVVRDGPPEGSGSHPEIDHIQARTPPAPPGGLPECGESTAVRKQRAGTGEPPRLGSRGRRFGSDILWQTGRNHSARSIGRGTSRPRPRRCGSGRIGLPRSHAATALRRCRCRSSRGTTRSHSVLCLIMRRPRVRARRRTGLVETRVSISASCIGPFHGRYSLETWKSSA